MKKMNWTLCLLILTLLTACDKLEDSGVINETLPGKWAFSYTTSEVLDYELSYQYVVFNDDGTCAIIYEDGQFEGTFRASDAVIRIETTIDGEVRTLLWKVLSMSPYKIVTSYDHEMNDGKTIVMTVTLDRL